MGKRLITDAMIFRAAELFLDAPDGGTVDHIKDTINEENADRKARGLATEEVPSITRETVYRMIRMAKERGFIRLVPPLDRTLERELVAMTGHPSGSFTVVDSMTEKSNSMVAARSAQFVLDHLAKVPSGEVALAADRTDGPVTAKGNGTSVVSLGLGPGRATLDFCRSMGELLRSDRGSTKFDLVAISAGAPADSPQYASSNFYNLFPADRIRRQVGFFAQSLVAHSEFDKIQDRPGIVEAFAAKPGIDVVVNSMGDISDPHDLLGTFLWEATERGMKISEAIAAPLREARRSEGGRGRGRKHRARAAELPGHCVGSVQYRPYSSEGAIGEEGEELRACTLFELHDFATMVAEGKVVVLIARQCGICGRTRAKALQPLLTIKELKVWSHIVMDVATARELLAGRG